MLLVFACGLSLCANVVAEPPGTDSAPGSRNCTIDGEWTAFGIGEELTLLIDGKNFWYSFSSDVTSDDDPIYPLFGSVETKGETVTLKCKEEIFDKEWRLVLEGNEICLRSEREHKEAVRTKGRDSAMRLHKVDEAPSWLPSYDMASLFMEADVVAEVTEHGRSERDGGCAAKVTVQNIYKGAVRPNAEIIVLISALYKDEIAEPSISDGSIKSPKLVLSGKSQGSRTKKSLMFLGKLKTGIYAPLDSGIKQLNDRVILAYRPLGRLGPYRLFQQRNELIDRKSGQDYTVTEFRRDLQASIERAEKFRVACDAGDVNALERFLPLLRSQQGVSGSASVLAQRAADKIADCTNQEKLWQILKRRSRTWDPVATETIENAIKRKTRDANETEKKR